MKCIIASFTLCLALSLAGADPKGPKVYISVDMEGISGIVHADQTTPGSADYASARRWMAEDVNAVALGLIQAGVGEIVVNDAHGTMRNILPSDLAQEVTLISGTPKPFSMMAGIDASFAACLFVGYHAKAGTAEAILDHTISSATVYAIRVNGQEMPELGLNAAIAGHYQVPVIMLSGDEAACRQARELLGEGITVAAVKQALGRNAAALLPMAQAHALLTEAAKTAFSRRQTVKPFRPTPPFLFQLAFANSGLAEMGELLPGVKRTDARTLGFEARDFLEGYKMARALIALAAAR